MENSNSPHRPLWTALSFTTFADATPEHPGGRMNFWQPDFAADYGVDCATGRGYASELIDYISETGDAPILTRIIAAMPRENEMSGVEVGFLTQLASSTIA